VCGVCMLCTSVNECHMIDLDLHELPGLSLDTMVRSSPCADAMMICGEYTRPKLHEAATRSLIMYTKSNRQGFNHGEDDGLAVERLAQLLNGIQTANASQSRRPQVSERSMGWCMNAVPVGSALSPSFSSSTRWQWSPSNWAEQLHR
jgi:hypothetical protein